MMLYTTHPVDGQKSCTSWGCQVFPLFTRFYIHPFGGCLEFRPSTFRVLGMFHLRLLVLQPNSNRIFVAGEVMAITGPATWNFLFNTTPWVSSLGGSILVATYYFSTSCSPNETWIAELRCFITQKDRLDLHLVKFSQGPDIFGDPIDPGSVRSPEKTPDLKIMRQNLELTKPKVQQQRIRTGTNLTFSNQKKETHIRKYMESSLIWRNCKSGMAAADWEMANSIFYVFWDHWNYHEMQWRWT